MKFSNIKGTKLTGRLKAAGAVCLLAVASLPALAAGAAEVRLNVELRDGRTDEYLLAEKPEIKFNGEECVISCKSLDTTYDMADVMQATFADSPNSVDENVADRISINLTNPDLAVVNGVVPGTPVRLYSIDGMLHCTVMADADGSAVIALSDLAPKTVYVVSINSNKNFKLYKK